MSGSKVLWVIDYCRQASAVFALSAVNYLIRLQRKRIFMRNARKSIVFFNLKYRNVFNRVSVIGYIELFLSFFVSSLFSLSELKKSKLLYCFQCVLKWLQVEVEQTCVIVDVSFCKEFEATFVFIERDGIGVCIYS